ncbi:hypothetical protein F4677DRAFT_437516 [Hypoxylon crocopeplum]|nr:hypothetical protein F4677DRAFT_437516 [Hypoxylon crocopeplum]
MDPGLSWYPRAAEPSSPDSELSDRRRKIRKGTHSCWPCKRRKVRCSFPSPQSQVCTNCQRRGSTCVGQDVPEELVIPEPRQDEPIGDRLGRVEALVSNLSQRVGSSRSADEASSTPHHQPGIPTPCLTDATLEDGECGGRSVVCLSPSASGQSPTSLTRISMRNRRDHVDVSRALLFAYPSKRDTDILLKALRTVPLYMWLRVSRPDSSRVSLPHVGATDLEPATINTHPVLIAKQMLCIAMALQKQGCHITLGDVSLSEPHSAIMERLVDAAIGLVTTNEEFHGTLESLACMQMEATFHEGSGYLRRAWLANRRALLVAQQMGVHQSCNRKFKTIDPRTEIIRDTVWFRILYYDRYYCLVLGFPQASTDVNIEPKSLDIAHDDPLDRLDRAHAAIAAHILERMDGRELLPGEESAMTSALDADLLRAAKSMPVKFWLHPNFHHHERDSREEYKETWLGMSQVFHYNLINQLHLPRLLKFNGDCSSDSSKLACMNANREVLARYLNYRSLRQQPGSCLTFEFLSLMAAITLLLAHFDGHLHRPAQPGSAVLEHQRLCDRTTMEQVLDAMKSVHQANNDPMSEASIKILRCLLMLEDDAAEGGRYTAQCVQQPGRSQHFDDEEYEGLWEKSMVLRISIPYFGVVRIKRESPAPSRPEPERRWPVSEPRGGGEFRLPIPPSPGVGSDMISSDLLQVPPHVAGGTAVAGEPSPASLDSGQPMANLPHLGLEECPLQQYWNPNMIEGADDWAFQGVDIDFFNAR